MDKITRAKEHLILYHPFFAYLALQVEFIREDEVGTSSIDGIVFRYNQEFLEQHDHRWCAALIAAGMGKVLLLHPIRAEGKNIERWNQASWYAVNSILKKAGIPLINDLYEPTFEGLDTEQIYELLKGEDEQNNEGNSEAGTNPFMGANDGSNFKSEDGSDICKVAMPDMSNTSESEMKSVISQKIMDAATQAKLCGEGMPDSIKEIIDELKEPEKDWREILHKFTAELARNDYDWMKPDETYLQRDIYIPGLHNVEIGGIAFAIDTSGSIDRNLLKEFLSELKEAVAQMTEEVTVIHCDSEVRLVEQVQTEDVEHISPVGRGGTKFNPVFDYIANNDLNPKALVYFTDGDCWDKPIEPDYPVIWCIYGNRSFVAPFGEVVFVDK